MRQYIFLISGVMGSGKDTIISELKKKPGIGVALGSTTRKPRPGEKDGIDYRFLPQKEFKKFAKQRKFLEWAKVHESFYGLLRSDFKWARRGKKILLIKTDSEGAVELKKMYPKSTSIFIAPPSLKEIRKRIKKRKMGINLISKRLRNAAAELSNATTGGWDVIVINKDTKKTISLLQKIIQK